MSSYVLFYTPGACSLSPHIALREAGLPFTLEKVDLRAKQLAAGGDFTSVNAKGYVPALRLPSGEVLTEGAVIVQYVADQKPEKQLAPPAGTMARYRLQEWLNFIATELHKQPGPLNNALATEDFKTQLAHKVELRWAVVAKTLADRPWLTGETFTIADGYMFYAMRYWQHSMKRDLAKWPELVAYYQRLAQRPSIAAALEAEGIKA